MAERAVIFDLDGTVWDSWPFYASVLAELTGQSRDDLLRALRNGESIVQLHKRLGISRDRFIDRTTRNADRLQLYDGIGDVLCGLKEAGNTLGVVTSLPGSIANPLLTRKRLSQLFDLVIPAKFGLPPKPNPRGLQACPATTATPSTPDRLPRSCVSRFRFHAPIGVKGKRKRETPPPNPSNHRSA